MTTKIAINGFGRIGRNILRAFYEARQQYGNIEVVAINDPSNLETNAYLLKYDSVHGRFSGDVSVEGNLLLVNGDKIHVSAERDPTKLPWKELDIDIVFECTGFFASRDKASAHLTAGAKKVLISAPAGKDVDATIVYGVNHSIIKPSDTILSNASCTTNCLAPLIKPLHDTFNIQHGLMVTIHAYTNDQRLTDSFHSDPHRARSATQSMIPTKTGAAAAVGLVMPELAGKLDGYAVRVPVINVSMIDLTFTSEKKPDSVDAINQIMQEAANSEPLKGVLGYNDEPLVSIDFNHCSASATFDATQTRLIDGLVKVVAWYDNEWGFSNRMLDVAQTMMSI